MGKENSNRLQTSLLNNVEKKLLVKLAQWQPSWVTSDFLTYTGVVAALLYAGSCWLANYNVNFLWLASLFLVINWYGDSLDGTLARVRNTQRPKYGFFIDHSIDALTTCLFCMGLGLGPVMRLDISLFIMGGYLCMSIYTYLSTIIMDNFRLTYASLGPTEARLIIIAVFILYIFNPWPDVRVHIPVFHADWTVYDFVGAAVAVILFSLYITSMVKDLRVMAKIDPPKPFNKKD